MDLPRLLAQNHSYFRFSCYRPLVLYLEGLPRSGSHFAIRTGGS
jgi:hypothetical protein